MQKMKAGLSEIARGILYVAWFVVTGLVVMWGLVVLMLLYMVSSGALIIDSESPERAGPRLGRQDHHAMGRRGSPRDRVNATTKWTAQEEADWDNERSASSTR
ncbi:MAG TPA: hypothetical protein VKC82_11070 [Burkholderiales bacterium]|nr:hypothetical protein [Burkholderiales bacterium]